MFLYWCIKKKILLLLACIYLLVLTFQDKTFYVWFDIADSGKKTSKFALIHAYARINYCNNWDSCLCSLSNQSSMRQQLQRNDCISWRIKPNSNRLQRQLQRQLAACVQVFIGSYVASGWKDIIWHFIHICVYGDALFQQHSDRVWHVIQANDGCLCNADAAAGQLQMGIGSSKRCM